MSSLTNREHLFLVGMMGSGKSTVAELLAKELEWKYLDTDHLIEEAEGMSVSQIFREQGEAFFRQQETLCLKKLTEKPRGQCVIATGGGVVLALENCRLMKSLGNVIYLEASLETLLERIGKAEDRPLLGKGEAERREILGALLATRDPLYREVANRVIPVDHQPVSAIVATAMEWYRSRI